MHSLTKSLAVVLACASMAIVVRAQPPESLSKPGPEVQKLAVMVGRFTNEGEVKAGTLGPNSTAMKVSGIDECTWTAGGFALTCTYLYNVGDTKWIGADLIYYDPNSRKYVLHGINNLGEMEDQTATVDGDTWTWLGRSSIAGKTLHIRYIAKFLSRDSYEYAESWSESENTTEPSMSGKCTRIVKTSGAADESKLSLDQQEVIEAHEARTEASNRRDRVAYSRYVADDCIFSTDDGEVITKDQLMAHVGKLPTEYDHAMNPREYVVHVYGDTAVLNLRYTTHERFTDSDIVSEMRMTETFIKRDGRWLLIGRQWAKMPVNFRKPVAVDTSVYKDYVGQYEWRPLDEVETISLKDGKLWTQFSKDIEEYLPSGADAFFVRSDLGTAKFVRDAQGRVTGYTYQVPDGQEIHVEKIK